MKKALFMILAVLFALGSTVKAQKTGYELGIRLGDTYGSSIAFDGMIPIESGRIHANLGLWDDGLTLAGLYNWQFPIVKSLYFYPGVGGTLSTAGNEVGIGAVGEVGLEYKFDIPISIGLDWRPVLGIINYSGFHADGLGLNVRYRF